MLELKSREMTTDEHGVRIHDPNPAATRSVEQRGVAGPQGGPAARDKEVRTGAAPDSVQISSLAEHLSATDAHSVAREARIERLAADVASGRYNPDPEAIAKAMVKEASAGE